MKKDELVHGFLKDCILQAEFKRGGKKKKEVFEMPKYRSQAVLGLLCPAKDALHRERDFPQGAAAQPTAALCCFSSAMKVPKAKLCFF